MDYANRRRVKVWGHRPGGRRGAALQDRLRAPEDPGKVERVILFSVEARDVNCPQHIHMRYSQRQVAPVIEQSQAQIAELEGEIARLRATVRP
jgi:hypothetical protein